MKRLDQLNAFNVVATGIADGRLLSIFVRDESGEISAGLYGWTWGGFRKFFPKTFERVSYYG